MPFLQDLESQIISANQLQADGVPSASIAILDNGKISSHVITNGKENTDTVYQACSISKAIAALGVAKLVDEGRIQYETKAIDHLPKSTVDCIVDESTRHLFQYVTVGMLLSHTSGLSQWGFPGYVGEMPSPEDIIAGRHPSNTPKMHFLSVPGAQWRYAGGGFVLLQLILENVTGMKFEDLMQETVFKPLSMTRSWYGPPPADEKNYAAAHATGLAKAPCAADYHNFVELAAAGLWTTPTDLLKAISAIQNSVHSISGFLSQETAKRMLTLVHDHPGTGGMALGWSVDDEAFAHAGDNFPGYTSYVFGFRSSHSGVAIMANSVLGHEKAIKQIMSALFHLQGWDRPMTLPSGFGKDEYIPYALPKDTKVDEDWGAWIGGWGKNWQLVDKDGPAWKFKTMEAMKLVPAAAPVKVFEDGKREMLFVVEGLKTAVRLTWEDEERVVQLLQNEAEVLKRADG